VPRRALVGSAPSAGSAPSPVAAVPRADAVRLVRAGAGSSSTASGGMNSRLALAAVRLVRAGAAAGSAGAGGSSSVGGANVARVLVRRRVRGAGSVVVSADTPAVSVSSGNSV
jgi:hypothetical protein